MIIVEGKKVNRYFYSFLIFLVGDDFAVGQCQTPWIRGKAPYLGEKCP